MADFEFKHRDQYDRELEWNRLRVFLEGELFQKCHEDVLPLQVEFAYSDEPVAFEDIASLAFQPLKQGEVWSTQNFGCAWFHLTGQLDKDIDRSNLALDFAFGGEGLLVDKNGHAIKGFTAGSRVFEYRNQMSIKRYYPADEHVVDENGKIDIYIDCASNNLLGDFITCF